MTHLEVTDFFLARSEVGGKKSENGLTADHHMATRATPWTNQGYRGAQWDPKKENLTKFPEVGLAGSSTSDRAQFVRGYFQFGH